MSSGTKEKLSRVVLDTNVLVSALGFNGKPNQVLTLALEKRIQAVTSPVLLVELQEVINKKFPAIEPKLSLIIKRITKRFTIVQPNKALHILKDEDDNRVLEASIEGKCDVIITGDKELLELAHFQDIEIITPEKFLQTKL